MFMTTITRGAAASLALPLTLALAACGDAADPTVATANDLQRALEMDGVLDLLGPGGPALVGGEGLPGALTCDADPEVTLAELCGHEYASEAHYAWSECLVDHPGDRPDVTSSGGVDLVRAVVGEAACEGAITLDEAVEFEVAIALPQGRSATMVGSSAGLSVRDMIAGTFTRQATIAATRSLFDDEGELARTIELVGDLEISVAVEPDGPVRTVSGALVVDLDDEESASVALEAIVHRPLAECAWPLAGTLTRTLPDAKSRILVFGPECGEATLDGEAIQLDEVSHSRHRRRRGRPF